MRLKDKVAIITGAADPTGMGAAFAAGFAKEGAKVVIADIVEGKEVVDSIEQAGGEALFVKADVTDQDSCFDMANAAAERFGTVDILVNNAALYGAIIIKTFMDQPSVEFKRVL